MTGMKIGTSAFGFRVEGTDVSFGALKRPNNGPFNDCFYEIRHRGAIIGNMVVRKNSINFQIYENTGITIWEHEHDAIVRGFVKGLITIILAKADWPPTRRKPVLLVLPLGSWIVKRILLTTGIGICAVLENDKYSSPNSKYFRDLADTANYLCDCHFDKKDSAPQEVEESKSVRVAAIDPSSPAPEVVVTDIDAQTKTLMKVVYDSKKYPSENSFASVREHFPLEVMSAIYDELHS